MKKFCLMFFALFLSVAFTIDDAQARRFGGARSFGMQRNIKKPPVNQTTPATPNKPNAAPNRWMGPLAGLAAGLGLAALASSLGLGEGFGSILLILLLVGAAAFIYAAFKKRNTSMAFAGAGAANGSVNRNFERAQIAPASSAIGEDFNAEAFIRHAKVNFLRLQAANDAKNTADIREFVSPEVFAEIKLDWDDRGDALQTTDVQNLNAEVLDVNQDENNYIVSVLFSGKIKENDHAPEAFSEIWHMTKSKTANGGWIVAGIEQND